MIFVDFREEKSIVPGKLRQFGVPIEVKSLEMADYVVGDIPVERKDAGDYVGSLISGHLTKQLYNLSYHYPLSILVVEGLVDPILMERNITKNVYISSLAGSLYKTAPDGAKGIINLVNLGSQWDTAVFLKYLHEKFIKDEPRLPKIERKTNPNDVLVYIVSSLPGVGEKGATSLLKRFKTISSIVRAGLEELMSADGIGEKRANEIVDIIHRRFESNE